MKRSFSLSELHESLEESGTMRRVKSQENMLKTMSPLSPAVGPHVARAPVLTEKELREHFNMPLNEVAKKYGMCTTALKKLCRKYGVMQWPHRKLRSLEKKIASLKAEQRYTTDGHGQLDDEIRKLESQRESLISGNGTVGLDDDAGGWSPTASSPAEAIDIADLYDSIGVDEMHHSHGDLSHQPRRPSVGAANARSFNSSDRAGERNDGSNEERLQHQIQTLEEENSSLKALSRSLMKERQELLNKTSATNVEMASLRQLCENLQLQLRSLTEGKGDAGRNPGLIQEDLLTDSKRKPLQDDAVMLGWNQQATADGGDLHALSWMAPDFDLDELL